MCCVIYSSCFIEVCHLRKDCIHVSKIFEGHEHSSLNIWDLDSLKTPAGNKDKSVSNLSFYKPIHIHLAKMPCTLLLN